MSENIPDDLSAIHLINGEILYAESYSISPDGWISAYLYIPKQEKIEGTDIQFNCEKNVHISPNSVLYITHKLSNA